MSLDDSSIPVRPASPADESPAEPPAIPVVARIEVGPDLRVPWTWLDLFLLAVISLVATVLFRLLLFGAFAKFGIAPMRIQQSPALFGLFTLVQQMLLIGALLGYLAAQLRVNFRVRFWRTIGWRGFEPGQVPVALRYLGFVVFGFAIALIVESVSLRFGNKARLPVQALFQDRRVALALMAMSVLVAPVFEETIFRGYIYPVVARSYGVAVGVLGTGILFGLLHAPQLWGGWLQISELVAVGIIFTYARAVTRTVLASFLLHVSYNFFVSFGIVLVSPWLRLIAPHR
jgi:membrane protease YdiL (CAAX protease family)